MDNKPPTPAPEPPKTNPSDYPTIEINSDELSQISPTTPSEPVETTSTEPTGPPPKPVVGDVDPTYSAASNTVAPDGSTLQSDAHMQPTKKKLPRGIYAIAGFNLLAFVVGFFDTSQTSLIYIIIMFVNLFVAAGLMLRLELARKAAIVLAGVLLVISIVGIFLLVGLQQRIHESRVTYETTFANVNQSKITSTQQQQLNNMKLILDKQENQAGKALAFTYAKLGITAVVSVAVIVYLRRPQVQEVFEDTSTRLSRL